MIESSSQGNVMRFLRTGILLLAMAPAFGSQSVQVTGGAASLQIPNTAPWTTIGVKTQPMRWELRLHNFGADLPYGSGAYLVNLGPVTLMRGQFSNWAQANLASSPNPGDNIYNNGPLVYGCCNTMGDI